MEETRRELRTLGWSLPRVNALTYDKLARSAGDWKEGT